jgi:hypothetical protein
VVTGFGYGVIVMCIAIAALPWVARQLFPAAMLDDTTERVGFSVIGLVAGFLLGVPFVVGGQLIDMLLDQRRALIQQKRLLERIAERMASSSPDPPEELGSGL